MKKILLGSALLAILQSILFWEQRIGISALIFVILLTCFFLFIMQKNNKIQNKKAEFLLLPIFLLASTYFLFNNAFLRILNAFVIPILIILMFLLLEKDELEFKGLARKMLGYILKPFSYMRKIMHELREVILNSWSEKHKVSAEKVFKIVKALIVTIPIAILVFVLLASADTMFAEMAEKLGENIEAIFGNIEIGEVFWRIVVGIFFFFYIAAFLVRILEDKEKANAKLLVEKRNQANDKITANMILTVLNSIYFVFCILQIKSMLLGPILDENFLYSEYAREGFFQLMLVSFINFATILLIKKNDKQQTFGENKYINIMCLIMLVFTFIILISSFARMNLYESKYGYTVLRLLVYFILITEAILLIPTAIYILKTNIPLAKIYMIILVSMYVILNFSNIDARIAKRNIDRYIETGKIDLYYLKYHVGTDAIPELTRLLKENCQKEGIENLDGNVEAYMETRYKYLSRQEETIWEFNLSNFKAKKAIEDVL